MDLKLVGSKIGSETHRSSGNVSTASQKKNGAGNTHVPQHNHLDNKLKSSQAGQNKVGDLVVESIGLQGSARSQRSVDNIFLPSGTPLSAQSSARTQRSELSGISSNLTETPRPAPSSGKASGSINKTSRTGSRVSSTKQNSNTQPRSISRGAEMETFLLDLKQLEASDEVSPPRVKTNAPKQLPPGHTTGDGMSKVEDNLRFDNDIQSWLEDQTPRMTTSMAAAGVLHGQSRSNWNEITVASTQDAQTLLAKTTPRNAPGFPLSLYDSEASLNRLGQSNYGTTSGTGERPGSGSSSVMRSGHNSRHKNHRTRNPALDRTEISVRGRSDEEDEIDEEILLDEDSSEGVINDSLSAGMTRSYASRRRVDSNTAAVRIQRWYRRHSKRRRSANAAMARLKMSSQQKTLTTSASLTQLTTPVHDPFLSSTTRPSPGTEFNSNSSVSSKGGRKSQHNKIAEELQRAREEKRLADKAITEAEVEKLKESGKIKSARSTSSGKTWVLNQATVNSSKMPSGLPEQKSPKSGAATPLTSASSTPRHNPRPRRHSQSRPLPNAAKSTSSTGDDTTATLPSDRSSTRDQKDRLKSLFAANKVTVSPRIPTNSSRGDPPSAGSLTPTPRPISHHDIFGTMNPDSLMLPAPLDTVRSSRSIVDDILSTLRELEHVETTPRASQLWRPGEERGPEAQQDGGKKNAWMNDIRELLRSSDEVESASRSSNFTPLPPHKTHTHSASSASGATNSSLTREKLRQYDEFMSQHQKQRISTLDSFLQGISAPPPPSKPLTGVNQDISSSSSTPPVARISTQLDAADLLKLSRDMEQSSQEVVHEVQTHVLTQRLELEERQRTVNMLQKALQQQRELTLRQVHETQKEWERRMEILQKEHTATVERNYALVDQLIDEKKVLQEKCDGLLQEVRTMRLKSEEKIRQLEESHSVELKKIEAKHQAAEKLRREKWETDKTKLIKEMTVKGMEAEIGQLIAGHKAEIRRQKQHYEEQLLLADERAYQNYGRQVEELRQQLTMEKEEACRKERETAKLRYESQMESESAALEAQRRRLYAEIQDEKERLTQLAARQKSEHETWKRELEEQQSKTLDSWRREFERANEEQQQRHQMELEELQRRLTTEKESWQSTFVREQEAQLAAKEREMRAALRKERDREIEMVLERLEMDSSNTKEECERAAENKMKRLREKYQSEIEELEKSEKNALEKYNQMKTKLLELEGDNERMKVILKQKDKETEDIRQLYEKLNRERENASDIIRQEFAERLVATDEENKRLKTELYEARARTGQEAERSKEEVRRLEREKEEELEQVHIKVKEAIKRKEENVQELRRQFQSEMEEWKVKYSTAMKRSEHLEGLLEEQRKLLLAIKK